MALSQQRIEELKAKPLQGAGSDMTQSQWEKFVSEVDTRLNSKYREEKKDNKAYNGNVIAVRRMGMGYTSVSFYDGIPAEELEDETAGRYAVAKQMLRYLSEGVPVMSRNYGEKNIFKYFLAGNGRLDYEESMVIRRNIESLEEEIKETPERFRPAAEVKEPGGFIKFLNRVSGGVFFASRIKSYNDYVEASKKYEDEVRIHEEKVRRYNEYKTAEKKAQEAWRDRYEEEVLEKGISEDFSVAFEVMGENREREVTAAFYGVLGAKPYTGKVVLNDSFDVPDGVGDEWAALVIGAGYSDEMALNTEEDKMGPYHAKNVARIDHTILDAPIARLSGWRDSAESEANGLAGMKKIASDAWKSLMEDKNPEPAAKLLTDAIIYQTTSVRDDYMRIEESRMYLARSLSLKCCLNCIERHPELKDRIDPELIEEARGAIGIYEAVKKGVEAGKELMTNPPEDVRKRKELLLEALAGSHLSKLKYDHRKEVMAPIEEKYTPRTREDVSSIERYIGMYNEAAKEKIEAKSNIRQQLIGKFGETAVNDIKDQMSGSYVVQNLLKLPPERLKERLMITLKRNGNLDDFAQRAVDNELKVNSETKEVPLLDEIAMRFSDKGLKSMGQTFEGVLGNEPYKKETAVTNLPYDVKTGYEKPEGVGKEWSALVLGAAYYPEALEKTETQSKEMLFGNMGFLMVGTLLDYLVADEKEGVRDQRLFDILDESKKLTQKAWKDFIENKKPEMARDMLEKGLRSINPTMYEAADSLSCTRGLAAKGKSLECMLDCIEKYPELAQGMDKNLITESKGNLEIIKRLGKAKRAEYMFAHGEEEAYKNREEYLLDILSASYIEHEMFAYNEREVQPRKAMAERDLVSPEALSKIPGEIKAEEMSMRPLKLQNEFYKIDTSTKPSYRQMAMGENPDKCISDIKNSIRQTKEFAKLMSLSPAQLQENITDVYKNEQLKGTKRTYMSESIASIMKEHQAMVQNNREKTESKNKEKTVQIHKENKADKEKESTKEKSKPAMSH